MNGRFWDSCWFWARVFWPCQLATVVRLRSTTAPRHRSTRIQDDWLKSTEKWVAKKCFVEETIEIAARHRHVCWNRGQLPKREADNPTIGQSDNRTIQALFSVILCDLLNSCVEYIATATIRVSWCALASSHLDVCFGKIRINSSAIRSQSIGWLCIRQCHCNDNCKTNWRPIYRSNLSTSRAEPSRAEGLQSKSSWSNWSAER